MRNKLSSLLLLFATFLAVAPAVSRAQSRDSGTTLRVLSFNVRTWTRDMDRSSDVYWRTRMEAMERMIADVDPDIICFQAMLYPATRYVPDSYKRVGGLNISHPIFIRKGLKYSWNSAAIYWSACDVEGVRIINVHSRWESDVMLRVTRQVNSLPTGKDLSCGDWNVTLDALKGADLNMVSAREILNIPEEDTFANFNRPNESHGAIDHFFLNGLSAISYRMITDGYGCSKMSDHFPIVLEIQK